MRCTDALRLWRAARGRRELTIQRSSSIMYQSTSSQSSIYAGLGFSDVSFGSQNYSSQSLSELQGGDPNSPEAFKQNVNLVQQQLARVQGLARDALSGM